MGQYTVPLGDALVVDQVKVVIGSCLFWFTVQAAAKSLSTRFYPGYKLLKEETQWRWNYTIAALLHSIIACALVLPVLLYPDQSLLENALYGRSARAQFAFAVSTGYFVWDVAIVVSAEKLDVAFLVHAVTCFFCYLFGQFPFLNYVGCWFLLFELSTPFLSLRGLLLIAGCKDTISFRITQNLFAVTFIVVRLCVGVPISIMFWRDMYNLLVSSAQHSTFAVVFYLLANIAMNSLNILWGAQIIKKGLGIGAKKGPKPNIAKTVKAH